MQKNRPGGKAYSNLGFYHKLSHLRSDEWNQLKELLAKLNYKGGSSVDKENLQAAIVESLTLLERIENYSAFPSKKDFRHIWELYKKGNFERLSTTVNRVIKALTSGIFRRQMIELEETSSKIQQQEIQLESVEHQKRSSTKARPYFELLVVDDFHSDDEEEAVRSAFLDMRDRDDPFIYDVVPVATFEDALIAVLVNPNIQSCVIRTGFAIESKLEGINLEHLLKERDYTQLAEMSDIDTGIRLGAMIHKVRPELDLFFAANLAVEHIASLNTDFFNRIFYREPGFIEHHHSILRGIHDRFQTPFYSALQSYSKKPTGVFHALPISRGKSIFKSNWISEMADFYGTNIFLAETSATSGGLDSLLQPHGPMKEAQKLASRAYGSKETYFVTNGTSTANKIVVQALIAPGDIVLVDRDCHKSHHYGMVLMGGHVDYLDSYPLDQYSMYGAVPLKEIKRKLLAYKREGKLDRVKMLLLTNCTFDGVVYNVRRVMEECLAIKPDLVFLWDEAWFAFASFNPVYRSRTGMNAAKKLITRYRSEEYAKEYRRFKKRGEKFTTEEEWINTPLLPDPAKVRLRVYSTHSTHKTLTSLRQGSMIHIYDQDFRQKSKAAFDEAYMTHTSTSPNYQILASLDMGRRQTELEGYGLVHKQLETAMTLREKLYEDPLLVKYFHVLRNKDMVPEQYRESGVDSYYDPESGWSRMEDAWANDEFVIDPTRITLFIGKTGIDGDTFKNEYLMDKYGIQINKTSRNTVLFMTNIGTNRSSIAYLIDVLGKIAREVDRRHEESSAVEKQILDNRIESLTHNLPPLPDFSRFHRLFKPDIDAATAEGDTRKAYFMSYNESNCEYLRIDNRQLQNEIAAGREVVSASFVTPYPPGFPVLVPGQVISTEILEFLLALDVTEIHGYRPELGLHVFRNEALSEG